MDIAFKNTGFSIAEFILHTADGQTQIYLPPGQTQTLREGYLLRIRSPEGERLRLVGRNDTESTRVDLYGVDAFGTKRLRAITPHRARRLYLDGDQSVLAVPVGPRDF